MVSFEEFVNMMITQRGVKDKVRQFGSVRASGIGFVVENNLGGMHQYSHEECAAYSHLINYILKDDEDCKSRVPIDTSDPEAIFHALDNGIVMCKILIAIDKDCIDARAINKQDQMNTF